MAKEVQFGGFIQKAILPHSGARYFCAATL